MTQASTTRNLRLTFLASTRSFDGLCSVEPGAEEAGAGAGDGGAAAAAAAAAGGGEKAWYEGLANEQLRTNPSLQNFKTIDEIANGYVNLEKRFGIAPERRLDLPADPNDKEGLAAVFAKLGRPEKPDGYGFKLDDKASDADKAFVERALPALHGANLTTDQAKGVIEFWQKESVAANEAVAAKIVADRAAGTETLKKEWGTAYDQKGRELGALLTKYGTPALAEALGGPDKLADHASWALFLGKVLDQMAEPGDAGAKSGEAANPDQKLTPAQAKAAVTVLESDPVKGKALREAGHPMHKAVVLERQRLLAMT